MGIERRGLIAIAGMLAAVLAACSPQGAAESAQTTSAAPSEQATHPVSGLKVIEVTVTTAKGRKQSYDPQAKNPVGTNRRGFYR